MGQDTSRYLHKGWVEFPNAENIADVALTIKHDRETRQFLNLHPSVYSLKRFDYFLMDQLIFSNKLDQILEHLFKNGMAFWVMTNRGKCYVSSEYAQRDLARCVMIRTDNKIYAFIVSHLDPRIVRELNEIRDKQKKYFKESEKVTLEILTLLNQK